MTFFEKKAEGGQAFSAMSTKAAKSQRVGEVLATFDQPRAGPAA
jgi:hypothetical protein